MKSCCVKLGHCFEDAAAAPFCVFTLPQARLSYKEIAEVLDVSRKTVENHMGLALSDIRD